MSRTIQDGLVLHRQGKLDQARAIYQRILAANPGNFDALTLLGSIALQTSQLETAADLFRRAISINPRVASAHFSLGNALISLQRPAEALARYDAALVLKPGDINTLINRGSALQDLKRWDEALASFDTAIALAPQDAKAHNNRGNVLMDFRRLDAALASYDIAVALDPRDVKAHYNRGNALRALGRISEALAAFDAALALAPAYPDAHVDRGHALCALGRLQEGTAAYAAAFALAPGHAFLLGTLIHTRMRLCDWSGLEEALAHLAAGIRASRPVASSFTALALLDDPDLHRKSAEIYIRSKYPGAPARRFATPETGKIRIGYFSADFHNHATSHLMAELFETHDRARFDLAAFSFGPDQDDPWRRRIARAFGEKFLDVRSSSDAAAAALARDMGIDIAIDLKGHTEGARTAIFADRCAPLQVNYLGYPGTMGADYYDYIIADATVIPADERFNFTEKVVTLPHSYQVNDSQRIIAERNFTRAELGLPEVGFVFCCFNNPYKILPATFDIWMRLLTAVEGSVLWLFTDAPAAADNLRRAAAARGVDGARLVFARRTSPAEHLARQRAADLFLDTLPYNAHTTASDALWAGLPVLTCKGKAFAGRAAASLLTAVGLPELITEAPAEYEAAALALARNPAMRAEIRKKLFDNRTTHPLFDAQLFTRHMEAAYEAMYVRWRGGLPPEAIEITP